MMIFGRRSRDPAERSAELLADLRQQHELNRVRELGLMNMPKHKQALEELKSLGPGAVPTLLEALSAPRVDPETVEGYVQDGVANDVAEVLGAIGDPRAVGPLMAAGQEYIVSAPRALATFSDGIDALLAALDDPDDAIRATSIRGLAFATRDRDRVLEAITRTLSDGSAQVRRTGAQAALIFEVADLALVAKLERVMREDHEDSVRKMAENAYRRLVHV
jgi:HEAT repeat protein